MVPRARLQASLIGHILLYNQCVAVTFLLRFVPDTALTVYPLEGSVKGAQWERTDVQFQR